MRKRTFWLSALALACGAASAQSSVTLWGFVDLNLQHTKAGGVGSTTAVGNGGLSTSLLGFRGTEDLGGGLKAGFWLEGSLNPDNGTGRATNSNNQSTGTGTANGGFMFDRRAYVSLSSSAGELRLGHDFVPTHYNSIYFDPFNANGVARAGNLTFAGVGAGPLFTAITASNSISYWLPPNLGGFYGMVMVALGENDSSVANSDDGNLRSVRFGYASGPFDIAAAASRTEYVSTTTVGNYSHANLGASWDAGFAKFFALYNDVKVNLTADAVRKRTVEVGAHIPVGPAGRIRVSYARLDDRSGAGLVNANGSARSTNDARQLGVGYVHNLSKRTALYGTYSRLQNNGQGAYLVSGGTAPAPGNSSTGLEFGLRHGF
jgi:predicted porin